MNEPARTDAAPPIILIALGGNALQNPAGDDSVDADFERTAETADHLARLISSGMGRLVITHGNGPQVGNHLLRSELGRDHGALPPLPLEVCVADTQGGIGYMLQQSIANACLAAEVPAVVASLVTQVVVDADDPAFQNPTKPIGEMIPPQKVLDLQARGWALVEDKHRGGWRRVVASPDPKEVVEADAIRALLDQGIVVIAGGGGGIPVVMSPTGGLEGVPAVVDKDLASALLASDLGADRFMILTDVETVFSGFGTDSQWPIRSVSVSRARAMLAAGEFAPGSMGPKMEAVCRFAESTGKSAVITSVDKCAAALEGEAGTKVEPD